MMEVRPVSSYEESLLPTYKRADIFIADGEGAWLIAEDGSRLLDFSSGVAVVNMGHRHPQITAAVHRQVDNVWHSSNHFWTRPMAELASRLSVRFGGAQVFFCNSGAEANEAVIKYARKATGRSGIVALNRSFHGRTCGALSITGQPAKRDMFYPLLPGVRFVEPNDTEALAQAVDETVGLVIMEPIQGEGGVYPLDNGFAQAARSLCDKHGALLAFDEIQTGVGRTGTFFGHEPLGVKPDLVSMAKGVANGLPIGCMLVSHGAAGAFGPGDHATTFGGNLVASAAGCATLDAVTEEVLRNVRERGTRIAKAVSEMPRVKAVRGRGLMIGCETEEPASQYVEACRSRGLVTTAAGANTLRLSPPLIIGDEEESFALAVLADVYGAA